MKVLEEKCYLCGNQTVFSIRDDAVLLREATCRYCGASIRNSDTARTIVWKVLKRKASLVESIQELRQYKILSTSSRGNIHEILKCSANYSFGEYFDDVQIGQNKNGVLCIDLRNIPFANDTFDLIISEDVLEHVQDVRTAFAEINRVLKMGGHHIFTVPVHENRKTLDRTPLPNKVYHGDPLRREGALVITDFGDDLGQILNDFGMKTTKTVLHTFHSPEEVTDADLTYELYLKNRQSLFRFFKYNSIVYCSTKKSVILHKATMPVDDKKEKVHPYMNQIAELTKWHEYLSSISQDIRFSGERVVINQEMVQKYPKTLWEHIARYNLAGKFASGKTVCDAACGTGYGSKMLQESGASSVIGIDIATDAVQAATATFGNEKLSFQAGNVSALPFPDNALEMLVSFETIEHVDDPERVIAEMARVLRPGGVFIVSTPNRRISNPGLFFEEQAANNPFHKHEFTIGEFVGSLATRFLLHHIFGQTPALPVECRNRSDRFDQNYLAQVAQMGPVCFPLHAYKNFEPQYVVVVCTKK